MKLNKKRSEFIGQFQIQIGITWINHDYSLEIKTKYTDDRTEGIDRSKYVRHGTSGEGMFIQVMEYYGEKKSGN